MFKITCHHCGATLKGQDVIISKFVVQEDGLKYKAYICSCSHCGGSIEWDRYAQKTEKNKAKAIVKWSKKQKPVPQITNAMRYNAIMKRVGERATEMASARIDTRVLQQDINAAVDELPKDEKAFVLAHEDELDMGILQSKKYNKPNKVSPSSMLLFTQAIIESAIAEKDEDFFKSKYGAQVCEMYNTALTLRKAHNYGITAELLLEKMRKSKIKVKGEA